MCCEGFPYVQRPDILQMLLLQSLSSWSWCLVQAGLLRRTCDLVLATLNILEQRCEAFRNQSLQLRALMVQELETQPLKVRSYATPQETPDLLEFSFVSQEM